MSAMGVKLLQTWPAGIVDVSLLVLLLHGSEHCQLPLLKV